MNQVLDAKYLLMEKSDKVFSLVKLMFCFEQ